MSVGLRAAVLNLATVLAAVWVVVLLKYIHTGEGWLAAASAGCYAEVHFRRQGLLLNYDGGWLRYCRLDMLLSNESACSFWFVSCWDIYDCRRLQDIVRLGYGRKCGDWLSKCWLASYLMDSQRGMARHTLLNDTQSFEALGFDTCLRLSNLVNWCHLVVGCLIGCLNLRLKCRCQLLSRYFLNLLSLFYLLCFLLQLSYMNILLASCLHFTCQSTFWV